MWHWDASLRLQTMREIIREPFLGLLDPALTAIGHYFLLILDLYVPNRKC